MNSGCINLDWELYGLLSAQLSAELDIKVYEWRGSWDIPLEYKIPLTSDTWQHCWGQPNTRPTASFSVSTSDLTVHVDASGSSDIEDPTSALQVRWDWTNDGIWDTNWTTTKTDSHTYDSDGTYTIKLQVKDTGGLTNDETKQVIGSANNPPVISDQSASTTKNQMKDIVLTGTDADNESLTFSIVTNPSHGTLTSQSTTSTSRTYTYTPTSNYTGSDSFTYKASDGKAESNIATVTITVNLSLSFKDPVVAGILTQNQLGTVSASCTVTTTDPNATVQSVTVDLSPLGASQPKQLVRGTNNQWSWSGLVQPPTSGTLKITFTATDDKGHTETADTMVTVNPPEISPLTVTNCSVTGSLSQNQTGTVTVSCTATDTDGEVQSVTVDLSPIGGSDAQPLAKGSGDIWSWSGKVTPASEGLKKIPFTAKDNKNRTTTGEAQINVGPYNERETQFEVERVEWFNSKHEKIDGVLESGQEYDFLIYLKNSGSADASFVDVRVASISDIPGIEIIQTERRYPDLLPGQSAPANDQEKFTVRGIPYTFSGAPQADVVVKYGKNQDKLFTISKGVTFNINPSPWLTLEGKREWDFVFVRPGVDVTKTITIQNVGNKKFQVDKIEIYEVNPVTGEKTLMSPPSDTTFTPADLPWEILGGGKKEVQVKISTTGMQGDIKREIVVCSPDANIVQTQEIPANHMIIKGSVSDVPELHKIPVAPADSVVPDVGGTVIVWQSDGNIYGYDLVTGASYNICTEPGYQMNPKISENLVAWEDHSTLTEPCNVFARHLSGGEKFPVTTDPKDERLVGVDGDYIAFVRIDQSLPGQRYVQNLFLYNVQNGSTVSLTAYTLNGNNPVRTVMDYDFGGGILAWTEDTLEWKGAYWDYQTGGRKLMKYEPENSPTGALVVDNYGGGPPSCNSGRIIWRAEVPKIKGPVQFYCNADTYCIKNSVNEDGTDGPDRTWDEETHGTESEMWVDRRSVYVVSLLRFDLSNYPLDLDKVVSADLHIYKSQGPDSWPFVEIQRVNNYWVENSVSGKSHPSWESASRSEGLRWTEGGMGGAPIVRSLPDPNWVKYWKDHENYGLCLRPGQYLVDNALKMNGRFIFVTKEGGDPTKIPYIEIKYSTSPRDQWWKWEAGQITQLTDDEEYDHNDPVVGNGFIVFWDKPDVTGKKTIYMWDFVNTPNYPNGRSVVIDRSQNPPTDYRRVDGDIAVFQGADGIYYTFCKN